MNEMAELKSDLASSVPSIPQHTLLESELQPKWSEGLGGGGLQHEAPSRILGLGEGQMVIRRRDKHKAC